jgi:hypothetical protein
MLTQTLFFTFNYLELNKLKIFKWKRIHFILPWGNDHCSRDHHGLSMRNLEEEMDQKPEIPG